MTALNDDYDRGDVNYYLHHREDFIGRQLETDRWVTTVSGLGNYAEVDTSYRNGILRLTSGSNSSRLAQAAWNGVQFSPSLTRYFKTRIKTLETSTETLYVGLSDSAFNNMICLYRTAGGAWSGLCRSAGVSTTTTTGLAANTTWNDVEIYINDPTAKAAYTDIDASVLFRINYNNYVVITTNIPTANLDVLLRIESNSNGVNRNLLVDYCDIYTERDQS
jgi:hypothetical protein